MINLEAVRARVRAAESQRAFAVMAWRALSPLRLSADDVPELVAEVMDLRFAVAARPMVGEVLTLREAVRTEVISMCAEYAATVDAVRALHSPESHGGMYCPYESGDRPECQECYPEGEDTGPGHTLMVCRECRVDEPWLNPHNRVLWPCATAKLLEPAGEVAG